MIHFVAVPSANSPSKIYLSGDWRDSDEIKLLREGIGVGLHEGLRVSLNDNPLLGLSQQSTH
jgi:hypothetical protein